MSAYPYIRIRCDFPDCYAALETYSQGMTRAREEAKAKGWTRVGGLDFCGPKPDRAQGYFFDNLSTWNNHAAQTDHLPVVKAMGPRSAAPGKVELSCSCGEWAYKTKYKWDTDTVSRSMVDHYWSEHVKAALAAEKEAAAAALAAAKEVAAGGDTSIT